MKLDYDPNKIENKWKENWFRDNIYEAVDFSDKPKKYILAELPYPSGKSLHVGHMMRYTVPEIYSRFLRMSGYNVLFPMGWDSFGLPAETYAQKVGITPQEAIAQASVDYKKAMQDMGYAIDWSREINTCDPEYYKWTQWTFKKLWEKGLAIQKEMPVWWCKQLGVLADEEVLPSPDGDSKISERGGYPVERKMFKQWVLDIPAYADRLISDLGKVNYVESVKSAQRAWIGRKEGIDITFEVVNSDKKIVCFTTTPVNWGATFIAIAPEHSLVEFFIKESNNSEEIKNYVSAAINISDIARQQKEKTGVFTNFYAKNHVTGENIPIWIADFVLTDVGTGAIQGCPGHDVRDFEFAQKYNIPIKRVVVGQDGKTGPVNSINDIVARGDKGVMINSDFLNGLSFDEAMIKTMDHFEKMGWGKRNVVYNLRPQVFSRQRYWGEPVPLVYTQDGSIQAVADENLPVELPIMKDFLAGEDGVSPLEKNDSWSQTVDSEGKVAKRETDTMPTWAGSNWYYLRYIDPQNKLALADPKKTKYWFPVDMYFGTASHTTAHLLYSRFWFKFLYDIGVVPLDEPYMYRMSGGMLLGLDGHPMSKSRGNVINPQELLKDYGADAVRLCLAFLGPYENTYPWNPSGLVACYKLLRTINKMRKNVSMELKELNNDTDTTIAFYKMVKNTTKMMSSLKMNTSVSEIMVFTNHLKLKKAIPADIWEQFIKVLAPFAPFLAEDMWQEFHGYKTWKKENSVHLQSWPKFDEKIVLNIDSVIPIQVNGKRRGEILVKNEDLNKKDLVLKQAKSEVKSYLDTKKIIKEIYIEGKIVNFVVNK